MTPTVHLVGDPAADTLLAKDPFALLLGMLLDQQIAMEIAFLGPKKIADRMDGLDVARIAETDAEEFAALCATPPAVHRFPGSMAKRIQALAQFLLDNYDGSTEALWTTGSPDGKEILRRLKQLPGFGEQKAKIFLALLGKQFALDADGWRSAAGDYGADGARRSIADVVDDQSLAEVRAFKKAAKAKAKEAKK